MAKTKSKAVQQWDTFHFNGPFALETLIEIENDKTIFDLKERFNDAATELQRLIQESADEGKRFRAFGSRWSMSNIAHAPHKMLGNGRLNIIFDINQHDLNPASQFAAENLFFLQCGNTIKELHNYFKKKGKSLKTCGASNGQTIAGAISTGVHGSAIDVGSMQDYVVGLNLIIGPNPKDIVYLERASRPALSDSFADSIHASVIRDDKLFNAALVGLGSFGIVHGVVVETEPLFLLKRYIQKISEKDAVELSDIQHFETGGFSIPEERGETGSGTRPFHFKLFVNAFKAGEYATEIIYKKPYREDYPNPLSMVRTVLCNDLPTTVTKIAANHPNLIPFFLEQLGKGIFKREEEVDIDEGTIDEIFWDTSLDMPSVAGSFGVDSKDSAKALKILVKLMNQKGKIPGLVAMRFVKGSEATLAFTRFPTTCVIEVDCVQWKPNSKIPSFNAFMGQVFEAFKTENIPFTLHWGKNAPWGYPGLIQHMYGSAAQEWKDMRISLLTPQMAEVFSNDFLDTTGLSSSNSTPFA